MAHFRFGDSRLTQHDQQRRQVVAGNDGTGMIIAQHPPPLGQRLAGQRLGGFGLAAIGKR